VLREEELIRIARMRRAKPWQEEMRYIQALILYAVADWPLVLKGGTYLWLFHGLNRFSADLDFTASGPVAAGKAAEISGVLKLFGVESETEVLKDDRYTLTLRVAAKGPLYKSDKDVCYVRLDISRREGLLLKPINVKLDEPLYGIPIVFLEGLEPREALAEKIRSFYIRGNARDLYDAWFLLRRGVKLDMALIEKKLAFYDLRFDSTTFFERFRELESVWERELEPVVFGAVPSIAEVEALFKQVLEASG
jgi:predicted nucleotidyltransferase component of viral defense system